MQFLASILLFIFCKRIQYPDGAFTIRVMVRVRVRVMVRVMVRVRSNIQIYVLTTGFINMLTLTLILS